MCYLSLGLSASLLYCAYSFVSLTALSPPSVSTLFLDLPLSPLSLRQGRALTYLNVSYNSTMVQCIESEVMNPANPISPGIRVPCHPTHLPTCVCLRSRHGERERNEEGVKERERKEKERHRKRRASGIVREKGGERKVNREREMSLGRQTIRVRQSSVCRRSVPRSIGSWMADHSSACGREWRVGDFQRASKE